MKKSAAIPFYTLEERGRGFIEIRKLDSVHVDMSSHPAHRDDNYILIYQESGMIHLMIDFQEVVIEFCRISDTDADQLHEQTLRSMFGVCVSRNSHPRVADAAGIHF